MQASSSDPDDRRLALIIQGPFMWRDWQAARSDLTDFIVEASNSTAAVYGARSAQGVVLVKTKRGQVSKPKISYNGQFGYTDEFYRSKVMDSYNFGRTWNAIRAAAASFNTEIL